MLPSPSHRLTRRLPRTSALALGCLLAIAAVVAGCGSSNQPAALKTIPGPSTQTSAPQNTGSTPGTTTSAPLTITTVTGTSSTSSTQSTGDTGNTGSTQTTAQTAPGGNCTGAEQASAGVEVPAASLLPTLCAWLAIVPAGDAKNVAYVSSDNPSYAIVDFNPTPDAPSQDSQGYGELLQLMHGDWSPVNAAEPCDGASLSAFASNIPGLSTADLTHLCQAYIPPVTPGPTSTTSVGSSGPEGDICGTYAPGNGDTHSYTVAATDYSCAAAMKLAPIWSSGQFQVDSNEYFMLGGLLCNENSFSTACGSPSRHVVIYSSGKAIASFPPAGATY